MRKLLFILCTVLLSATTVFAQQREIDTTKSKIKWLGKKISGEHTGHISFSSGTLEFDDGILTGGGFIVDMNSITCSDISDKEYNAKLVGHLKSDDFFGVANHPLSKLKITSAKQNSTGYTIKADLTIKGETHPIEFKATQNKNKFSGSILVDRTRYNVRYGSGKFFDGLGDKMIYDNFELNFDIIYN